MNKNKAIMAAVALLAATGAWAEEARQEQALDEMSVKAAPLGNEYTTPKAFAATKTDTPLLETPMAIQVVPREVMDDQQVISIKDAIKNVSGVMSNEYEYYDFVQIRGFSNGYAANYHDGLQLQAISGLETALLDRIEIVKGPASMLFGRIEPGGLVNLVSKKPQAEFAASLQQQIGEYGRARTTVDVTGKMNEDASLMYRVIGAYSEADSFMDYVQKRNEVGAAYLTWKPNSKFELNLRLEGQRNKFVDTEDIGIPIIGNRPARVSRSSFFGDPVGWEIPNRPERSLLGFDWSYAFNDSWKITQRFHWDNRDEQQFTIWNNGFNGVDTLDRGLWYVHNERETLATNLDLTGDVKLGGMRHRLLAGVDWFRFTSEWHGFSDVTALIPAINIFNPVHGNISAAGLKALPEGFFYTDHDEWHGLYLQDQISLNERWELLLGGRYDWAVTGNGQSATSLAGAFSALALRREEEFSPRAGVLYKATPSTSVYASYSESFGANNGVSATGAAFAPQTAKQYEIGGKYSALDESLTGSIAIFHLVKNNILTPDISTPAPNDQIPIGQVRNRGVEVDISGRVTNHVNVIATYAYSNAVITKDNSGNAGNTMPNVPRHAASVWAKYDTAPGAAEGWQAGAGAYVRSQRQGDNANSWQLPGYARIDAMLGYRTKIAGKGITAQVNIQNLFDTTYFDRGGSGGTLAKYGEPRTAIGSLKIDF